MKKLLSLALCVALLLSCNVSLASYGSGDVGGVFAAQIEKAIDKGVRTGAPLPKLPWQAGAVSGSLRAINEGISEYVFNWTPDDSDRKAMVWYRYEAGDAKITEFLNEIYHGYQFDLGIGTIVDMPQKPDPKNVNYANLLVDYNLAMHTVLDFVLTYYHNNNEALLEQGVEAADLPDIVTYVRDAVDSWHNE